MNKKELNEEELKEVDGGLLRKPYPANAYTSAYKLKKCNDCGHEFYNYYSFKNTCPECGSENISDE